MCHDRIFSNSWGSADVNGYDNMARMVDEFMYAHPDALVFFAAGNAGYATTTTNKVSTLRGAVGFVGLDI